MARCRDITGLISRGMDARLSSGQRLRIRLHLLICTPCLRFAAQVRVLRAASRRLGQRLLEPVDPV